MATDAPLNVIALVSGGKDSFFSILHCQANGHRVVALANLHPPEDHSTTRESSDGPCQQQHGAVASASGSPHHTDDDQEADLNSFMYQTVGHQVIPLYAAATGLPLFRQAIVGTAVCHGKSYSDLPRQVPDIGTTAAAQVGPQTAGQEEDETESLVPLLRAVVEAHPEANALCTGAILSTYQRTRVESVALRLGLVPLAYLWQFPVLPISAAPASGHGLDGDAQLLRDMAALGLEARIVKVASAGLGEDFLWENVASEATISRIERALKRFGGGGRGSVLGEGGEFETLVVDGPATLFMGRIVVSKEQSIIVREGGGSSWLNVRGATVEMKTASSQGGDLGNPAVRVPELLETRFEAALEALHDAHHSGIVVEVSSRSSPHLSGLEQTWSSPCGRQWCFVGNSQQVDIEDQTAQVVADIQQRLGAQSLPVNAITGAVIVLRHMSDFPTINKLYGALFQEPNPPARVTISCGESLPQGSGIAVYLTSHSGLTPDERQGLHVQSRSYWAPANIGPYSQAIAFPLMDSSSTGSDQPQHHRTDTSTMVTIAGQIPLIPATMALPAESPDSAALQVTLALQHLWRIGVEMQVQWWTSAVAYFPQMPSASVMKQRALLAARAWRSAHIWSNKDPDEDGPDLWDRKYNPLYMSLAGGAGDTAAAINLPAWDTLPGLDLDDLQVNEKLRYLPFAFAAEVEELPRAAGVEWHAHMGLAKVGSGSIHVSTVRGIQPTSFELHHVIVVSDPGVFIHTVAAVHLSGEGDTATPSLDFDALARTMSSEVAKSLESITGSGGSRTRSFSECTTWPYFSYVDSAKISYVAAMTAGTDGRSPEAVIPCHSLWDAQGGRLSSVLLFEHRIARK
ncbi:uncharacterized protein BCR38DRAFT_340583 [Pseudomassariella vexata]|uniref:Diphthine--ammonia ligase n=1 Tax=Pseudomassariella vexata TaxID=1141098 RepID=A0A1Y2E380_9PEZI|nr:uncharacterized protein BCR38DRAFT_340583 [Pseudomassariella vexata]ORY65907.1 hypothetical protein BCR38DRAFT_340583 [Pseudomassariella vexata]